MKICRVLSKSFLIFFILSFCENAHSRDDIRDFTIGSNVSPATLTCPRQPSGFPKQQVFIKSFDGKNTRGWKANAKSIKFNPGLHKIVILYYFVGLYRTYDFEFTAEPNKNYLCIARISGDTAIFTIEDRDTGKIVAEPTASSKDCFGRKCG